MFPEAVPLTIKEPPDEILKAALVSTVKFPKVIFSVVLIVLFALTIILSPLLGIELKLQLEVVFQLVFVNSKKVFVPVTVWVPNRVKVSCASVIHSLVLKVSAGMVTENFL